MAWCRGFLNSLAPPLFLTFLTLIGITVLQVSVGTHGISVVRREVSVRSTERSESLKWEGHQPIRSWDLIGFVKYDAGVVTLSSGHCVLKQAIFRGGQRVSSSSTNGWTWWVWGRESDCMAICRDFVPCVVMM